LDDRELTAAGEGAVLATVSPCRRVAFGHLVPAHRAARRTWNKSGLDHFCGRSMLLIGSMLPPVPFTQWP
jgi:hypothetical protein